MQQWKESNMIDFATRNVRGFVHDIDNLSEILQKRKISVAVV
jgi:hypothetical protein